MSLNSNILYVDFDKKKKTNMFWWRANNSIRSEFLGGIEYKFPTICSLCESALIPAMDINKKVVLICFHCRKLKRIN